MLAEMITKLADQTKQAMTPHRLTIDDENDRVAYYWNPATQKIEQVETLGEARDHTVLTLPSLVSAVGRFSPDLGEYSVWVSLRKIQAVLDDGPERRRHRVTLDLTPSTVFEAVQVIPISQKKLMAFLRHDLRPSQVTPPNLMDTLSALRWETNDVSTSNLGTVKSTMGREINAEVKAQGDIPPEASFTFEPFPELADFIQISVTVTCSVVIDPESREITIRPYPGQIKQATCRAIEALRAKLVEMLGTDDRMVFAGTP